MGDDIMAGIYFSNLRYHEIMDDEYSRGGIHRETEYNGWFVQQFVSDKFLDDKLFYENDDYIVLTDGGNIQWERVS